MVAPSENEPVLKLPHPYLTPYVLATTSRTLDDGATPLLQIKPQKTTENTTPLPEPLHNDAVFFTKPTDLKSSERPPVSNNTAWGRARRSPASTFTWEGEAATLTLSQAWLLIYVLFTIRPSMEHFRLTLSGPGKDGLAAQLKTVLLAIDHPIATGLVDELLVLRSTFWQGAGSPWGPRTAWIPEDLSSSTAPLPKPLSAYPLTPLENTMTNDASAVLTWHPRRPAKPAPGSIVYSRWIPHLRENFSMVAFDYKNEEHVNLFHTWHNDPRVSQGWNVTGTLESHREYLRAAHVDPHRITLLAAFDGVFFAYFEVYWAKVSKPPKLIVRIAAGRFRTDSVKPWTKNRKTN